MTGLQVHHQITHILELENLSLLQKLNSFLRTWFGQEQIEIKNKIMSESPC